MTKEKTASKPKPNRIKPVVSLSLSQQVKEGAKKYREQTGIGLSALATQLLTEFLAKKGYVQDSDQSNRS